MNTSNGTEITQKCPYKVIQDYVIYQDKMLGNGTYGTVFQGIHKVSKENVAIKVIPIKKIEAENSNPQQIFQQIRNEIENMRMIEGQHIVRLIDKKKTSNCIYLILEYCNGGNLQSLLKVNQGSLSESQAVNIIFQITEGYKCLIAKNMAHRDLKPANILFKDGIAKIGDFGFSKVIGVQEDAKLRHSILGSPQYMSPQLLQCQEYCPKKADMWSLGYEIIEQMIFYHYYLNRMIFFEVLYRKVPWRGESPLDLLSSITSKPLNFPPVPQVSLTVKKVISYMLKIDEQDRISWEELINEPLFESQTQIDLLTTSLNSLEMRFVNDSYNKMKEYCRLYILQNRVYHNLFECVQKETFNKHIIDCNISIQNFTAFSDQSIDPTSTQSHNTVFSGSNPNSIQAQKQNNNSNNSLKSIQSTDYNELGQGATEGGNQQEFQLLFDYSVQVQYRQVVIKKLTDYYLKKRNKGIFFAHLAIILSDIFDQRDANLNIKNSITEVFMLRNVFTLFKKGYLKIYKAFRRIKTNEPDKCTKFALDDYKTFDQSNERIQLRKYFNFDLNMLKCLFDELLQKVLAFQKKHLPSCSSQDKGIFDAFLPIINHIMNEKDRFDPIFKASVDEQDKVFKKILKSIPQKNLENDQNPVFKSLLSLAFYISCVNNGYQMFKQANNLDYCKFYEMYERSSADQLMNLVFNKS